MQPYPPPPPPPKRDHTVWIVVAIVGGIVAITGILLVMQASEASRQYMKKTKRGEAEVQLDYLQKATKAWFAENAAFVTGSAPLTPSEPCCGSGRDDHKCEVDPSQWETAPWDELDFRIDEPHLYQYAYEGTAEHFVARAVGDLDCDGEMSTYTLEGDAHGGNPTFELTKPTRAD